MFRGKQKKKGEVIRGLCCGLYSSNWWCRCSSSQSFVDCVRDIVDLILKKCNEQLS